MDSMEAPIVPRRGLSIDLTLRDRPFALVGIGGGALALWAEVPVEIAILATLLVALDIRVRFHS